MKVWMGHAGIGNKITVNNLATAKIDAAIPTKLDENAAPIDIVFSNSGSTGYYIVALPFPYVDGIQGTMLIYDADGLTLKSTLPLSVNPTALLMAPDGLTAYIIGNGKVVYYDLLSGTVDLTVAFPAVSSTPWIHPAGNHIFILQSFPTYAIFVFDVPHAR